ncbi:protein gp37 [Stigmatella aurantiaca]|uniref:Protein gp37 n=1 Tax=Stigmatella aurantiaca TaxID=41 RepID=A0A1H8EFZ5_STIAU|nr:DUF5131 family protein [Stigmatella aurantiaca]SEN18326.1 protein gp37 [Stigmatella aurantiaca]
MGKTTGIQWCDSTVNPTMGCDGCELWEEGRRICYAGLDHERKKGRSPGYAPSFDAVTRFPGRMLTAAAWRPLTGLRRLEKPWLDALPRLIFVSDMSDALSQAVSFEYLEDEIINTVESPAGQQHHWLWLTKRSPRMREFSRWLRRPWPANLWVGTSITGQQSLGRIRPLLEVGDERTIRFLSIEPQWEALDLGEWLSRLNWIIQGGQSGKNSPAFDLAWARAMRDACQKVGVRYFLKQLGANVRDGSAVLKLRDRHGGDWNEWPTDLRIRQLPLRLS